ncbi:reverse transcriptase family protein [Alienimonas californiensis]|uniref:reverse transcriptase family protein n=1 Tax=Alienimonas californiensis TaxID=2527989 RepID=UPI0013FD06CE|nr:reverse transcriptase family protein [Alienimonas californiensis]
MSSDTPPPDSNASGLGCGGIVWSALAAVLLLTGLTAVAVLAVRAFGALVAALGASALIAIGLNFAQWYFLKRLKRVDRYSLFRLGHRWRAWRGKGFDIEELARRCGLTAHRLQNHQPSYHTATIPKPSGGERTLTIPDPATMDLQRTLLRRVLARLHADPAACGFERGKGIVDHAAPHVGRAVVATCDLKDFFPSVTAKSIDYYFRRVGWNAEAAALLTRLTTSEGGLPQGAPTSPRLSNLLMHGVDYALAKAAGRRGFRYTRYADDLAFSSAEDDGQAVRDLLRRVEAVVRRGGFELNSKKTRVLRRHQRQMICGLVVNDRLNLPRKIRRELRAALHRRRVGREATYTAQQLAGWAGVLTMVARGPRAFHGETPPDSAPSSA